MELLIDEAGGGVRAAVAALQAKIESGVNITDVSVQHLGYHLHREGGDTLWEVLFDQLGSLPLLRFDLSLRGYIVSTRALLQTLRRTTESLESLTISDALFDGDINELSNALQEHPSLKIFSLWNCRVLRGEAIQASLMHALSTCRQLEGVSLRSVAPFMSRTQLGPSMRQLCMSPNLQKLILIDFDISGDWTLVDIFECLKSSTSLTTFEARNNFKPMGKNGIEALGRVLTENSTLEDLFITAENTSLRPMATALKTNRTLKHLRVDTLRRLPEDEADLFLDVLQENHVLEGLKINASPTHTSAMQFYSKLNTLGYGRLLNGAADNEWLDVILSNANDVSTAFFLLSKNPKLCQRALSSKALTKTRKRSRHLFSPGQSTALLQRALSSVGIQRPAKRQRR